jgi:biopolymer transport protein ExbB/TolQ
MDFKLLMFTLQHDWAVLLPIAVASVMGLAVILKRASFFNSQSRSIETFIPRIQRELAKRNYENAAALSEQFGGAVGHLAYEGVQFAQLNAKNTKAFSAAFDISQALAVRRLENGLNILGTIGTVAPYLGLFGTVVRILLTFGEMANAGNGQAAQVMFGIGSALIATAFGLGVAILAVVANNYFRGRVEEFENDFSIVKLTIMSAMEHQEGVILSENTSAGTAVNRMALPL